MSKTFACKHIFGLAESSKTFVWHIFFFIMIGHMRQLSLHCTFTSSIVEEEIMSFGTVLVAIGERAHVHYQYTL